MAKAKIACFDIEASNLKANFGIMLCAAIKWVGVKKAELFSMRDYKEYQSDRTNDKYVVKALAERLAEADIWVSWYGRWFDYRFINARLVAHGLPMLPPSIPHIDCWKLCRDNLLLHNNRLMTFGNFIGASQKTPVTGPIWIKALTGQGKKGAEAFKYIEQHCIYDVEDLQKAYMRLRPMATQHPNVSLSGEGVTRVIGATCPKCGSSSIQKRGQRINKSTIVPRFFCVSCSSWSLGKSANIKGVEVR